MIVPTPIPTASSRIAPGPAGGVDWSGWRLPLPAGEWRITRGPCGSANAFDHECGYYENSCALDYAPLSGSMENVPVLAPADGVVFFVGTRDNAGQMLMVRHLDGRVSGYMHLARVVAPREASVVRGQVLGYAGSTGTAQAHLHFWVQPDAVQRACVDLAGLEQQDVALGRATSTNRNWTELDLVNPPSALPDWLPLTGVTVGSTWRLPARVRLPADTTLMLPVAVRARLAVTDTLLAGGAVLEPTRQDGDFAVFRLPARAPGAGASRFEVTLALRVSGAAVDVPPARLNGLVESPPIIQGLTGTIQINPTFVSPANYAVRTGKAELCWEVASQAGTAPLRYRALIVRDPAASAPVGTARTNADSGWVTRTCWTTPTLAPGAYLWKVFVSDAAGLMNRPNQRPQALVIR